jgi:uncharacterized protein YjiS (DUF1127 family)
MTEDADSIVDEWDFEQRCVMKKKQLVVLVRAILAQMSEDYSVYQVDPGHQLRDLGINDTARVRALRNRLLRALAGKEPSGLAKSIRTLKITPSSSVVEIASGLGKLLRQPRGALLPGIDPTKPKGMVEAVVKSALAEKARGRRLVTIAPTHRLADFGLGKKDVRDVQRKIYRGLTGKHPRVQYVDFSRDCRISLASTVRDVVDSAFESLPGIDPTRPKP